MSDLFNEGYEGGYNDGVKECEPYMREWVSVKDRLPEKSVRVLICNSSNVYIGHLVNDWFSTDEGFGKNITHWMPLPNPPIEDTSNE